MKQRFSLILSATVVLFASCRNKGGNTSGLLVPKDAGLVVHINSASLSSKLSWNEIKATNWFQSLQNDAKNEDTLARRLLNDPSRSGIDTKKDFIIYTKKHGQGGFVIIEGLLTDAAMYEQLLAEMNKKQPKEIKKDGEFSYMEPKENTVLVWNKSKFAVISNANLGGGMAGNFMKGNRSSGNDKFEADSLRIFGEQALSLEGNDLETDSRYAELVRDGSDFHIWINAGEYNSGLNIVKKFAPMAKLDALYKDTYTAMSINFDNGKISAKVKHYYNDQMAKIAANNKPGSVTADLINRIPSSDIVVAVASNFSPNALKETLNVLGVDVMADAFLTAKFNLTIEEITKATKGQVLFAVTDLTSKADTIKMGGESHVVKAMPNANVLVAVSVKDKAAFDKIAALLDVFKKQFMGSGMGDNEGQPGMGNRMGMIPALSGINYKLTNDWFVLTNSPAYTDKFLAGANSNLSFTSRISGHPAGAFIDLQRIIRFAQSMSKDSMAHTMFTASLNMWQDITVKSGDYKDKYSEGEFEINLVDKNTNSLKQLNQYIDKLNWRVMKGKETAKIKEVTLEDITDAQIPPPPPVEK